MRKSQEALAICASSSGRLLQKPIIVAARILYSGVSPGLVKGVPEVHLDIRLLERWGALWPNRQHQVAEWRGRTAIRRGPYEVSRDTPLQTSHVETRHSDHMATYAKAVGVKPSEGVNAAFRQFLEGKS